MSKNRVVLMGMLAVVAVLAWALPASAKPQAAKATVTVTAGAPSEFAFKLSAASVKAGSVTFKVVNKGNLPHDFKIAGKRTKLLQGGQSATLTVTLKKGKQAYLCTVSGHAAAGMKGTLTVK